MDDIDEDALDDATYEVYETPRNLSIRVLKQLACLQYICMVHRNTVVLQAPSINWTKLSTLIKAPSLKRTK